MHLLLDSSGLELVCALGDSQGIIVEERFPTGSQESRDIGTVAGRILGEILVSELESVVVGTGPGSFIGTRVAISYANGLASTGQVKLIGVNSLAATAAVFGQGGSCVIRDARRGEVYLYGIQQDQPETQVVNLEGLPAALVAAGYANAVVEDPGTGQARLIETYQAICGACSNAGLVVTSSPGIPAEGLRRAGMCAVPVKYIEPEYLRSFL